MGPAARRRPARGDLVPLARGPPRQALPRRPHPRLHLPARPARLRLRPDAAGRAGVPPLGRADARRDRRQPPFEVRPPAGGPQAHRRGGARMTPAPARSRSRTHARTAPHGSAARLRTGRAAASVAAPAGAAAPGLPPARHDLRVRARPRAARAPRRRPPAAQPRVDLGARRRCSAASWRCRSRCSSSTPASRARSRRPRRSSARTPTSRPRSRSSRRTDRIQTGAAGLGMLMPPAGDVGYLSAGPQDAARAVRRMQPPSEEAAALLANRGVVPGSLADVAPPVAAVDRDARAGRPRPRGDGARRDDRPGRRRARGDAGAPVTRRRPPRRPPPTTTARRPRRRRRPPAARSRPRASTWG